MYITCLGLRAAAARRFLSTKVAPPVQTSLLEAASLCNLCLSPVFFVHGCVRAKPREACRTDGCGR